MLIAHPDNFAETVSVLVDDLHVHFRKALEGDVLSVATVASCITILQLMSSDLQAQLKKVVDKGASA